MVYACHAICQQDGNGWGFCFGCLKGCGTDLYITGTQMLTQSLYWASPFWLSSFFRIGVAKVQRKEGKWSKAKYVRYHWQEELGWTHSGGSWKLKLTYGSWILGSWRIKGKFLCGVGNPYFGIKGWVSRLRKCHVKKMTMNLRKRKIIWDRIKYLLYKHGASTLGPQYLCKS